MSDIDARIASLAAGQFGVVSRAQLLAGGLSPKMIRGRVNRGLLVPLFATVYALAGVPASWRGRLMAAQLWLGERSVVSHRSAGALYGLDGVPGDLVELTLARGSLPSARGVCIHSSTLLRRPDVRTMSPFKVTSIERTLG